MGSDDSDSDSSEVREEKKRLLAQQKKVAQSAENHLARMKKEADDYVKELTIISNVSEKIMLVLKQIDFSKILTGRLKVFPDLRERLCGDISNLSDKPGRREVITKEVCIMSGEQLRGVTIFVFNDVIVTTAAGSSKEFEIFQHKIELDMLKAETVGARLKLSEHDPISGSEKSVHAFECDTEETAETLKDAIEAATLSLTRTTDVRVKPDNFVEVDEEETLEMLNERLANEVKNLKERERGVDKKLREQMNDFVELRSQQWDTDYERAKMGLTIDPRTLNTLQSVGGVTGKPEEVPLLVDADREDGEEDGPTEEELYEEEQKAKEKVAAAKILDDEALEETAVFVSKTLDGLIYKFEALEEVMTTFTRLQLFPEEVAAEALAAKSAAEATAAAAAAAEKGHRGEEEEGGAGEVEEEAAAAHEEEEAAAAAGEEEEGVVAAAEEEEAGTSAEEEEGTGEEAAGEPGEDSVASKEAEEFWDVITRVRGSLSVLGGKMSELDEQFWTSRMGKAVVNSNKKPPAFVEQTEEIIMTSDEVYASQAAVEKELLIETQRAADLKKARAERREIVDNALRNLSSVGKKAHLIHKK